MEKIKPTTSFRLLRDLLRTLICVLAFFSVPTFAADDKPSTYSPDKCEFSVTFPGDPSITHQCDDQDKQKCYDEVSYTHVFDMEATVNFRIICNSIDPSVYKQYSAEIMAATLRAMTNKNVVKTFDTSFREENGYKQAGLVGEGKIGRMETIYIAQLWIGDHSALSVEAELLGKAEDKADKLFSDVLKSVVYVGDKKNTDQDKDKKDDTKDSKKDTEDKKPNAKTDIKEPEKAKE
jgi:hypothetical protein